jgi:hypothetical protein
LIKLKPGKADGESTTGNLFPAWVRFSRESTRSTNPASDTRIATRSIEGSTLHSQGLFAFRTSDFLRISLRPAEIESKMGAILVEFVGRQIQNFVAAFVANFVEIPIRNRDSPGFRDSRHNP